ncbi:MAG: hypothetical protein K0R54_2199 [Clostridiaceae bacterium]|jgi:ABC-type multidrug transport system permease subunit|nr:hypothetical protein [Clostridiaceae bacterium]
MRFQKYRKSVLSKVDKSQNDNIDNRIHFKDFVALFIATFQVMVPILIVFFAIFSFCVFLLIKFWVK